MTEPNLNPTLYDLPQHEREFALWLADHAGRRHGVLRERQRAVWQQLTGYAISDADLIALKKKREFIAFFREARTSARAKVAEAQALAHAMYPAAMRIHARALKRADQAGDYKAVPPLTENIWKRVLPVQGDIATPTNVTINLTTTRLAALAAPAIEVQVEELPLPPDVRSELP